MKLSILCDSFVSAMQRWTRANRDRVFHEYIDTNNGTEALNKALKYTCLPKGRRVTKLSGVVTILIETFLPALRHKYLLSNRPVQIASRTTFLITCTTGQRKSYYTVWTERFQVPVSQLQILPLPIIAKAPFSGDNTYTVNFQTPSCTCRDWTL